MMRMTGKTAFITGGGSGIGAATARLLAAEGARVVIADLNLPAAQDVAGDIARAGGAALAVPIDVTCSDRTQEAVATAAAHFGRIDTVFACAGITANGTAEDMKEQDWDRVMAINLKGVFLTCKHTIPEIRKAGGGSVVLAGSITSFTGTSLSCAYAASKSALVTFSRNTALKFAHVPIRVNLVCPGHCETPLVRALFNGSPDLRDSLLKKYPMGRFAREDEIAQAVLFLASDESSFVTGTELIVDGGFLAA